MAIFEKIKEFFFNKYLHKAIRYGLVFLVGWLEKFPFAGDLAALLHTNTDSVTNAVAGFIVGLVAFWSVKSEKVKKK